MPKFTVQAWWNGQDYGKAWAEVEAPSKEEAIKMVMGDTSLFNEWKSKGGEDYEYDVNTYEAWREDERS